jgi:transposase
MGERTVEKAVIVEHLPRSDGKPPVTCGMMGFLPHWARRLSGRETTQASDELGSSVWFVQWGLAHRELKGVKAMGVNEIHWGRGLGADNFLTVIYQMDAHSRRRYGAASPDYSAPRRGKPPWGRRVETLSPRKSPP